MRAFLLPKLELKQMQVENESYGTRLEKKIDQMQSQMSELNNAIIRLSERNEAYQSQSGANKKDIDVLEAKVQALENQASKAEGGINALRWATGLFAGALLSVLGLAGSSIIETKQIAGLHEAKLIRLDTDINAQSQRISSIERREQP